MKKALFRVADAVIVAAVALVALLGFVLVRYGGHGGEQVVIETAGQVPVTYDLAVPTVVTVAGENGISLTITIENGRVRVTESGCPDRVCVHTGWLSRGGQSAVCVPAGVTVRVVGGDNAVDGVTA